MKTALKIGPVLMFNAVIVLAALSAAQMIEQKAMNEGTRLIAVDTERPATWRYTLSGWQDANEWTATAEIAPPPARRFDNLHPAVLAMLILTSALAALFWASNEWELAQLWGECDRSKNAPIE